MTGRSPARFLAPLALIVAAIALFAVLASGGGESPSSSSAEPTATAPPAESPDAKGSGNDKNAGDAGDTDADGGGSSNAKTYTIKAGDTPSGVADRLSIDLDQLLEANPDIDPDALTVGDKLKLP